MKRKFSIQQLADLGILGEKHYDEWRSLVLRDVEHSTNNHGTAVLVTIEVDGRFWQFAVGYYHEDWSGTNDLVEASPNPHFQIEADEVWAYTEVRYRKRAPMPQ